MALRLKNSSGNFIALDAPSSIATDVTLTLPNTDGDSGQYLQTDGAGALSWQTLTHSDMPTGSILQVVQTHVITTSSQSLVTNTTYDITNLSVDITPKTSSSNMLVFVRWHGEVSSDTHETTFGIKRDSTEIGNPATASNRRVNMSIAKINYQADFISTPDSADYHFLDTGRPSGTSQITYKATVMVAGTRTFYNNRTGNDTDSNLHERLTSSITVMEVAA